MSIPANVERFSGFAERYDTYRPKPPAVLVDILTQLAQVARPRCVVDLGSGTGLSSSIWAERADQVIGIEPNADMRSRAEARTAGWPNVVYRDASAQDTGLPNDCADVVTCSQSLHWMEPEPTFAEIARVLRVGGVFAAYDCDWPPTMNWQAQAAYEKFDWDAEKMGESRGWYAGVRQWAKEEHLGRMHASRRFRYVHEFVVHHQELGNAERLVGLALSQGGAATLLKRGLTEQEIGVDELRHACEQAMGSASIPWYFSYRVRIGIK